MGQIKKIIKKKTVPKPKFNARFCVELCENVHIHYRNLRLEFDKDEFLLILEALKSINEEKVDSFKYSPSAFKQIVNKVLPQETEFDKRLQIEEQVEGHHHVHYRNLRIEVDDLDELGYD